MKALRQTVDLSAYPDLVVVYLGMTVNALTGVKTLFGFGPKIEGSVAARPDGLLLHENISYSLFPLHVGMQVRSASHLGHSEKTLILNGKRVTGSRGRQARLCVRSVSAGSTVSGTHHFRII